MELNKTIGLRNDGVSEFYKNSDIPYDETLRFIKDCYLNHRLSITSKKVAWYSLMKHGDEKALLVTFGANRESLMNLPFAFYIDGKSYAETDDIWGMKNSYLSHKLDITADTCEYCHLGLTNKCLYDEGLAFVQPVTDTSCCPMVKRAVQLLRRSVGKRFKEVQVYMNKECGEWAELETWNPTKEKEDEY